MALPQLQNEASMVTAYEAMEMQDTLEKIDGGVEVVWETLDKLVEINSKSMDVLVDMLKIETDTFEAAQSQKAFDEEAAADAEAQKEITGKEEEKGINQMIQENGSLIAGVISAVTGLMAMKDWIADGFKGALREMGFLRTEQEKRAAIDKQVKALEEKTATTGLTEDEALERDKLKLQQTFMDEGMTAAQASGAAVEATTFQGTGEFSQEELGVPQEEIDKINEDKLRRKGEGQMLSDFQEIMRLEEQGAQDWFRLGGIFDPTYDQNYQNEIDKKIERITKTATRYNLTIPENIQYYIDQREEQYETDEGDASYMSATPQQELERSVPTPMDTIIEPEKVPAGSVTPTAVDALGTGSAASGRIDKSGVSVNPSANPNVVNNIGAASGGTGAPVVIDNSTTNNNTVVQGGGGSAPSTGQTVSTATRSNKSPQDPVRDRSK